MLKEILEEKKVKARNCPDCKRRPIAEFIPNKVAKIYCRNGCCGMVVVKDGTPEGLVKAVRMWNKGQYNWGIDNNGVKKKTNAKAAGSKATRNIKRS